MALPLPASGRGMLRGRVLGFPVSMHAGFVLLSGVLAFASGLGLARTAVWLVVVGVSVLVHELGHAFVMRTTGAKPTITLYAFGGVTQGETPASVSRGKRLGIALAGPAAGIALGALVYAAALALPYADGGLVEFAFASALFANVGWGVLNLLPMLPLDGGHVLMTLLPGDDAKRFRLTSVISIGVGAAATALALYADFVFAAVLAGYFTLGNVATVRGPRPDPAEADIARLRDRYAAGDDEGAAAAARDAALRSPQYAGLAAQLTAAARLAAGDATGARDALLDQQPGTVDPPLEVAVLLATGNDRLGLERLPGAVAGPVTPYGVRALARVLVRRGEDPVARFGELCDAEAWRAAMEGAYYEGAHEAAARLGERALSAGSPLAALVAYNVACSWARAGDEARALDALRRAFEAGFLDVAQLDADPDLAAVRAHPDFAALRVGR